jgi:para-nitrobenzyl esterase
MAIKCKRLMKTPLCCILLSLFASLGTGAVAEQSAVSDKSLAKDPIVNTDRGKIAGKRDPLTGTSRFLGIPYAAPPTRELRWKAPEPVKKAWPGVRDAFRFGSRCPQLNDSIWTKPSPYSEDCLYLNVWVPPTAGRHAVMFYIHGGGFLSGDSGDMGIGPLLNGAHLATRRDVVVVTINYRLGALGFLVHPSLEAEKEGLSGNYGLLDMIAALKWVQANIENFGGDPKKVMIFGHSAGANATCAVLVSPLAKDLFSSAAIQSGWCGAANVHVRRQAGIIFAEKVGCPRSSDAGTGDADTAACLRTRPVKKLLKKLDAFKRNYYIFAPWQDSHNLAAGPTVDGKALPDEPLKMLTEGSHNNVPLIIGSTHDEFEFFISDMWRIVFCGQHDDYINKQFQSDANKVLKKYPCPFALGGRQSSVQAAGDFYFTCPLRRAARAAAASQSEPVYQYLFSFPINSPGLGVPNASHLADIPHVFGTFFETLSIPDWGFSLQQYWAEFARTGDPNVPGLAVWSRYDPKQDNFLNFGLQISEQKNLKNGLCDFWDKWPTHF